jgi:hypothetical protein
MLAAVRFLWNATRGSRLRPWRSEYLRWRVETYSGMKAETVDVRAFWAFVWQEKFRLLRFLSWTGEMHDYARKSREQQRP